MNRKQFSVLKKVLAVLVVVMVMASVTTPLGFAQDDEEITIGFTSHATRQSVH